MNDVTEPTSYKNAIKGRDREHWRAANAAERESINIGGVFRPSKLPSDQRAIGTKQGGL